jgi:hypothetical protein
MDIQNVPVGLSSPDLKRQAGVSASPNTSTSPASGHPADASATATRSDRLDLSGARPAEVASMPELQFAKKALNSLLPADESRLDEIRQRVQDGYYNSPEAQDEIAGRLQNDILGKNPFDV